MISHCSVHLGGINTADGNWENLFLKPEIVTHTESTNSYGSAPELGFLDRKGLLLQTKKDWGPNVC